MRHILFSLITFSSVIFVGIASAQVGMMGNYGQYGSVTLTAAQSQEIDGALQDVYKIQGIESQSQIDCSKVTDDQFDKLGDVYMGTMLQNPQQHEAMDNMMGGEGSASLRQAHINMGRSYLGCWANYNSGPVHMPMMGGYGYSMMGGWGGYGIGSVVFMVILWTLAIIGLVTVTKWIINNPKK